MHTPPPAPSPDNAPLPRITRYQEALDYIYSFLDRERRPASSPAEAQHNLDRTRALLAALGNPQQHYACVVVGGTKGKGSTSAMLESMLRAAGYRTGLWTSPHLTSYRERIQVDRTLISPEALVAQVQRLVPRVAAFDTAAYGVPTAFELGFALALDYFATQQVQVAVVEVGLGGRYDCANVLTPLVSVISSISYDHMRVLGDTLDQIAYDKAGIFKPGVPAASVPQAAEAARTLAQVAAQTGTPFWLARSAGLFPIDASTSDVAVQPYPTAPRPALRGAFQEENARLALGAALLLRTRGLTLPDAALAQGLATVRWPGRLEVVGRDPWLVLDGAHNGYSIHKLVQALQAEFSYTRLHVVLGCSRDKPLGHIMPPLVPHAASLILTRSSHPRAHTDLDRLAAVARPYLRGALHLTGDLPDALACARQLADPTDLICVTGSLFVVGAARAALHLPDAPVD